MEKKKIYKIIAIVLAILAIVVIAVFIAVSNKPEESEQEQNQTELDYAEPQIDMKNLENAELEEAVKRNNSAKVHEDKVYNDMKISNAEIFSSQYSSQFSATITNPFEKPIEGEAVYVVFLKQDGNEIARVETFFPDMEPNSENILNASSNLDIANSYDFYIEKVK